MAREAYAVEVSSLRVRYGQVVAVDGVDLVAGRGQVVALLGPNGAGKTSTIEVAEGYRRAAGGWVRVLGYDPVGERRQLVPLLGVMLQGGGVYPGMGPAEALSLFARYYDNPDDPRHLLALVGLERVARSPWRRLSGGERQRLSLALALVGRPRVVFLDEPTSGVDPEGRQVMRQVISGLREAGSCVVLTTHELEEAERLADVVYVIDRGRILASGTLEELAAQAGRPELRWQTSAGLATSSLSVALGAPVREESPGNYAAAVPGSPAAVRALAGWLDERGLPLAGLRAGRAPLEEVYLRLTGADSRAAAEHGGAPAASGEGGPMPASGEGGQQARSDGGARGPAAGEGTWRAQR